MVSTAMVVWLCLDLRVGREERGVHWEVRGSLPSQAQEVRSWPGGDRGSNDDDNDDDDVVVMMVVVVVVMIKMRMMMMMMMMVVVMVMMMIGRGLAG